MPVGGTYLGGPHIRARLGGCCSPRSRRISACPAHIGRRRTRTHRGRTPHFRRLRERDRAEGCIAENGVGGVRNIVQSARGAGGNRVMPVRRM